MHSTLIPSLIISSLIIFFHCIMPSVHHVASPIFKNINKIPLTYKMFLLLSHSPICRNQTQFSFHPPNPNINTPLSIRVVATDPNTSILMSDYTVPPTAAVLRSTSITPIARRRGQSTMQARDADRYRQNIEREEEEEQQHELCIALSFLFYIQDWIQIESTRYLLFNISSLRRNLNCFY